MRVILRSDLQSVGTKGEVVEVADGYARNYLLPRGLAMKATKGAEAQGDAMRRARSVKDAAARSAAEEIAKTLVPTTIHVTAKTGGGSGAGEGARLFGSVTSTELAEAIKTQTGIDIDRRAIHLDEPIRTTGSHQATARLHPDVQFPISVEVASA
ncbi:MAG: 50S ribosomal protein L9 [Actinobacteria bacterium]|nr:50S ribosomal protein L9 [Actinomycetota bacterium]